MVNITPKYLLFAQHGWADTNSTMMALANRLVQLEASQADVCLAIVAPDLGYLQTWLRIEPLIQTVEKLALQQRANYPHLPFRIVGHSMGGLIWLEVLSRHPEWWADVHSLILIASPVGGADLGRMIDPFGLGIGIAADLGKNRKPLAERIAATIPTLIVAGNCDEGSDGTVPVECTKFANARFVCLPGLSHPVLRNHPAVVSVIQDFWRDTTLGEVIEYNQIIRRLHAVPGITDAHWRGFREATVVMKLDNGGTIRTWKNGLGIDHVFVACPEGKCLYAGFVGWLHTPDLEQALTEIRQTYAV
jgi:pimeloyl-ACP methyl ester carboxylesterase